LESSLRKKYSRNKCVNPLVWGATVEEHDERLMNTLQRCEEIDLTVNKEKCEFRVKEVTYIGHKLTRDRVKPDEQKVKAI
jgi:hypothetical protein